jgi:hypothetical protein
MFATGKGVQGVQEVAALLASGEAVDGVDGLKLAPCQQFIPSLPCFGHKFHRYFRAFDVVYGYRRWKLSPLLLLR